MYKTSVSGPAPPGLQCITCRRKPPRCQHYEKWVRDVHQWLPKGQSFPLASAATAAEWTMSAQPGLPLRSLHLVVFCSALVLHLSQHRCNRPPPQTGTARGTQASYKADQDIPGPETRAAHAVHTPCMFHDRHAPSGEHQMSCATAPSVQLSPSFLGESQEVGKPSQPACLPQGLSFVF